MKLKCSKIIKLLISIMMILVMITGVTFASNNENKANAKIVCDEKVEPSEEMTISIKINGTSDGIMGIQGELDLDNNIFEILDKTVEKDGWMLSMYNDETNKFLLEVTDEAFYDASAYIHGEETILNIKVKVKDEAKGKKSEIKLSNVKFANEKYETIEVEDAKQVVKVKGSMSGIICIVAVVIIALGVIIVLKKRG